MTTVSKFPLLQLPQKEILRTLRIMNMDQKISFSLISKQSKKLVQSLKIKANCISASISGSIYITVSFSERFLKIYFQDSNEYRRRRLRAPKYVFVGSLRLERIGFEYSDWLKHFQDIFHNSSIANIAFHPGSSKIDVDDIKKVFGVPKELYARNAYNLAIFQKFQPVEKLTFSPNMIKDPKILWNIFQQNYTALDIVCDNDPGEMALNDLLLVNSKSITIQNVQISPQDVNKFIKLWMKGSSPRMEYLKIFRTDRFRYDIAVVMKGIQHSEVAQDDKMEIYKMNGTRATIIFKCGSVQMRVWFD